MAKFLVVSNYDTGRTWKLDVINMDTKKTVASFPVDDWYDFDMAFTSIEERWPEHSYSNYGNCPYGHEYEDRGEEVARKLVNPLPVIEEIHLKGIVSLETGKIPFGEVDFGIQISKDGRVWICVNGIALVRFKPTRL